jgi:hypothetical protein
MTITTLIIPISVGQPYHEGRYLEELRAYLLASSYTTISIIVADTLQRHNLLADDPTLSEEAAAAQTAAKGLDWISRNSAFFRDIPNLTITRWSAALAAEVSFSDVPAALAPTIEEQATPFVSRMLCRNPHLSRDRLMEYSRRYIAEELTVLRHWWLSNNRAPFAIYYPRDTGPAFRAMNAICCDGAIRFLTRDDIRSITHHQQQTG